MSDPIIKIENMNKWFGDFQVLKNINLEVQQKQKIETQLILGEQYMILLESMRLIIRINQQSSS